MINSVLAKAKKLTLHGGNKLLDNVTKNKTFKAKAIGVGIGAGLGAASGYAAGDGDLKTTLQGAAIGGGLGAATHYGLRRVSKATQAKRDSWSYMNSKTPMVRSDIAGETAARNLKKSNEKRVATENKKNIVKTIISNVKARRPQSKFNNPYTKASNNLAEAQKSGHAGDIARATKYMDDNFHYARSNYPRK